MGVNNSHVTISKILSMAWPGSVSGVSLNERYKINKKRSYCWGLNHLTLLHNNNIFTRKQSGKIDKNKAVLHIFHILVIFHCCLIPVCWQGSVTSVTKTNYRTVIDLYSPTSLNNSSERKTEKNGKKSEEKDKFSKAKNIKIFTVGNLRKFAFKKFSRISRIICDYLWVKILRYCYSTSQKQTFIVVKKTLTT